MRNRVFITGAGAACPLGLSVAEVFAALEAARSALGPLRRFDTRRLRTDVGGEVDRGALLERLGAETLAVPFLREPLRLADNAKLAFALAACAEALGLTGWRLGPAASRAPFAAEVALYTTAGLEELRLDDLWAAGADGPRSAGAHLCRELPPTYVGEVLCHVFGFSVHPPVTVSAACASSTQALGEAARAVAAGEADVALAGGTDSMLYPVGLNAFNSLGALAERPACRLAPFDAARTGTLLGEGAAYFLLAGERAAARLGLEPRAEVLGYASSMDGYHPVKPHPAGRGAAAAMRRALADAALDEVDYVNAHGSGTPPNDAAEAAALREVLGPAAAPLVSSTKPFYGHLLTAAGAVEVLSVLLALERSVVPPTLNLARLDERVDFDCVPGVARRTTVRAALKNSFGLHGQNGVLVLGAPGNG